jgi:hypothetical protein
MHKNREFEHGLRMQQKNTPLKHLPVSNATNINFCKSCKNQLFKCESITKTISAKLSFTHMQVPVSILHWITFFSSITIFSAHFNNQKMHKNR